MIFKIFLLLSLIFVTFVNCLPISGRCTLENPLGIGDGSVLRPAPTSGDPFGNSAPFDHQNPSRDMLNSHFRMRQQRRDRNNQLRLLYELRNYQQRRPGPARG